MPKSKIRSEPKIDTIASTVTIPLRELIKRVAAGESHAELHRQRMTKADWKIYRKMTPEDQGSVENVIGQLRTGMANNNNRVWLEQKRAELFKKYT